MPVTRQGCWSVRTATPSTGSAPTGCWRRHPSGQTIPLSPPWVTGWKRGPRKQVNTTVVGSVGWKRAGPLAAKDLPKVMVLWGNSGSGLPGGEGRSSASPGIQGHSLRPTWPDSRGYMELPAQSLFCLTHLRGHANSASSAQPSPAPASVTFGAPAPPHSLFFRCSAWALCPHPRASLWWGG